MAPGGKLITGRDEQCMVEDVRVSSVRPSSSTRRTPHHIYPLKKGSRQSPRTFDTHSTCLHRLQQLPTPMPRLLRRSRPQRTNIRSRTRYPSRTEQRASERCELELLSRGSVIDVSASKLPPVMLRVALLAVLRSKRLEGATIGIMVTASHNPEPVSSACAIQRSY